MVAGQKRAARLFETLAQARRGTPEATLLEIHSPGGKAKHTPTDLSENSFHLLRSRLIATIRVPSSVFVNSRTKLSHKFHLIKSVAWRPPSLQPARREKLAGSGGVCGIRLQAQARNASPPVPPAFIQNCGVYSKLRFGALTTTIRPATNINYVANAIWETGVCLQTGA